MVIPPPRPEHSPQAGDPIWTPIESGNLPLVVRFIAYRGEGRFAVETDNGDRHIVKWDDDKAWTSILSWCPC